MDAHVDVIVPRGGRGLIERISRDARVPVIKHLDGNCHVFIDDRAEPDMAVTVAVNAKTYRYGICGAMETLLVGREIAPPCAPDPGGAVRASRRGAARLRGNPEARRRRGPGHGRGLGDGVPRADPRGADGRRRRRGDGAHRPLRLRPHGRHRDRRPRQRPPVHDRGRFELGHGERSDLLLRRIRVRDWARRSGSAPTSCTPAGRSDSKGSRRRSTSCSATDRYAADRHPQSPDAFCAATATATCVARRPRTAFE